MKHIKKYLTLALSVAFCASFQTFTMEKERSRTSKERFEEQITGTPDTSGEGMSDLLEEARIEKMNRQQLAARIKTAQSIAADLKEQLEDFEFTPKEHNEIKELQKYIQETIEKINAMLSGHIPINMKVINHRIETIHLVSQRHL